MVSKRFREKAQFSLEDIKNAASVHTDGLIPAIKMVELLEYLNILTTIDPSQDDKIFFMPSVLKNAEPEELYVQRKDSDPFPLMLFFNCGYVPMGLFPLMITNVVSKEWPEAN